MKEATAKAILDAVQAHEIRKIDRGNAEVIIKAWLKSLGYERDRWDNYAKPGEEERFHFKTNVLNRQYKHAGEWRNLTSTPLIDAAQNLVVSAAALTGNREVQERFSKAKAKRKEAVVARATKAEAQRAAREGYLLAMKQAGYDEPETAVAYAANKLSDAKRKAFIDKYTPIVEQWKQRVLAGEAPKTDDQFASADRPPVLSLYVDGLEYTYTVQVDGVDYTVAVRPVSKNVADVYIGTMTPGGGMEVSATRMRMAMAGLGSEAKGDAGISGRIYLTDGKLGAALFLITSHTKQAGAGTRALRIWCAMMAGLGIKLWVAEAVGEEGAAFLKALERKGTIEVKGIRGANWVIECKGKQSFGEAKKNPTRSARAAHKAFVETEKARAKAAKAATRYVVVMHSSGPSGGYVVREGTLRDDGTIRIPSPYSQAEQIKVFTSKVAAQKHADKLNGEGEPPKPKGGKPFSKGISWPSPGGMRRVEDVVADPRTHGKVYVVGTEGSDIKELIKPEDIDETIRRDREGLSQKPRKRNPTPAPTITLEQARKAGEDLGVDWDKSPFDAEQFRMGMQVELEHGDRNDRTNLTDDGLVATAMIALAHLNEFDDYYYRLDEMERKAKADAKKPKPKEKAKATIRIKRNGEFVDVPVLHQAGDIYVVKGIYKDYQVVREDGLIRDGFTKKFLAVEMAEAWSGPQRDLLKAALSGDKAAIEATQWALAAVRQMTGKYAVPGAVTKRMEEAERDWRRELQRLEAASVQHEKVAFSPDEERSINRRGTATRGDVSVKVVPHASGDGFAVETTVAGDRRYPTEPPMTMVQAQQFALEQLGSPRPASGPSIPTPSVSTTTPSQVERPYVNTGDIIDRYIKRGLNKYEAWRQFVKDTILQPIVRSEEINSDEFFAVFDRQASSRNLASGTKPRLAVREMAKGGYLLSGTDSLGRRIKVAARTKADAQAIKREYESMKPGFQARVDAILMGEATRERFGS